MTRLDEQLTSVFPPPDPLYPEDDGKPLSENTIQFRLIATIAGGLQAMYREAPNVFIAADLLWYPVEGQPNLCQAPDVMVVFGRPKQDRRSYLQWREENLPPQVSFEIGSQSNTLAELEKEKLRFYQRHGVEEYYVFYPLRKRLKGWQRQGSQLVEIPQMQGWTSPRLALRFEQEGQELYLYRPDGERLRDYPEVVAQLEQARQQSQQYRQRAQEAESQREQYRQERDLERHRAEEAELQREQYRQERDLERQRLEGAVTRLLGFGLSLEEVAQTLSLSLAQVREMAKGHDN